MSLERQIVVRVDEELAARVEEVRERTGLSQSGVVRMLIMTGLEVEDRKREQARDLLAEQRP